MTTHAFTVNRRIVAILIGALLLTPFLSIHAESDAHTFAVDDHCYDCSICMLSASASGDDALTDNTHAWRPHQANPLQRIPRVARAAAAPVRSSHPARAPPVSLC